MTHRSGKRADIRTAEILSVGSELTVGETRDTNAGELARELSEEGVAVLRLTAVPDRLETVTEAFGQANRNADLVVSTGGLGPTPDDLTREAIAELCGEVPAIDDRLDAWLRELWFRRGIPFPEMNLKQAWLIPSARAIPNRNGTAPGWWVERPDSRLIVALPGPPREMRPMWRDTVLPQLRERGLGIERVTLTLRLWGIGESQAADLIGDGILRGANPVVATYARSDSVDVRISAAGEPGRPAAAIAAEAETVVRDALGSYLWGTGDESWPRAIGERLGALGWTLAATEVGTGGAFAALFGEMPGLVQVLARSAAEGPTADRGEASGAADGGTNADISELARKTRADAGAHVGMALVARPHGGDTRVTVGVVSPLGSHRERRVVFQGGPQGRSRAVLTAAWILLKHLAGQDGVGAPAASEPAGTSEQGGRPRTRLEPEKVS